MPRLVDRRVRDPGRSRRIAPATGRRGFTLIELMIAVTIGAFAVASIYSLGRNSNHYFQQQYRVTNAMSRLRVAMGQIKRDLHRAGFMATPNANGDTTCGLTPIPASGLNYAGVLNLVKGTGDGVGMDPAGIYTGVLPADQLRLLGNYETAAEYPGLKNPSKDGWNLELEQWWHAFRKDFHVWETNTPTVLDIQRVRQVFANRPVRVSTNLGRHHFSTVQAVLGPLANAAGNVRIQLNPGLPVPPACALDLDGGWIAPLKVLQYQVEENTRGAARLLDPRERLPELVRQEITLDGTPIADTRTVIAQYVVRFNVDFIPIRNNAPPDLDWVVDNSEVLDAPHTLRIARVTLSVRAPGFDPTFPPATPLNSLPYRRFSMFDKDAPGAARVRTLRADIFLPNMVR